jgi:6,7-dimethyl-8-ribityllumazine synthase
MKKIAIITTKWNTTFVDPCVKACEAELLLSGLKSDDIDIITVPGAVELPLIAKSLAKTKQYSAIIAIAFVYGG